MFVKERMAIAFFMIIFFACGKLDAQVLPRTFGARAFQIDDGTSSGRTLQWDLNSPLTSSYQLHFPNTPPSTAISYLVTDANGNMSWINNPFANISAWELGGNTIGASTKNQLGTLDNKELQFITNGLANVRMSISPTGTVSIGSANQFQVDNNGNITQVNNIPYSWPTTQASSSGMVLTNDATGNLSWIANGSTVTVSTNSQFIGAGSLNVNPVNDLTLNSTATYFRISSSADLNVTGLNSSGVNDGRMVILINVGSFAITLKSLNGSSASGNQFDLPGNTDVILAPKGSATFIFDAADGHWTMISTN